MEIQGKTVAVLPIESGTSKAGNAWSKQQFVIETKDQYPKKVCFQLFGEERVEMCPKVGDDVCVKFDVNAREYNGRWYTEVNAWSVEVKQPSETEQPAETVQATQAQPQQPQQAPQTAQSDELPF